MGTLSYNKHVISACLELNDKCSVLCPYCLLECQQQYISQDHLFQVIDRLFSHGVRRFSIGGGEPLQSNDVYETGKYIKNLNAKSLLRTSACEPLKIDLFTSAFDMVDISIDSTNLEVYRRCKPNADLNIVLKNMKVILKSPIKLRCNVLVTALNYDDIINTIHNLLRLGVKTIRFQRLVMRGLAKNIYNQIKVSERKYNELVEKVRLIASNSELDFTELESTSMRALCIVKPNGYVYIANPFGLEFLGDVFEQTTLVKVGEQLHDIQKSLYKNDYE